MSLLTEQEIDKCIGITDYTTGAMKNVLTQIARTIEAKVIEKIKAQGPAVRLHIKPTDEWPDVKTEVLNGDGFPVEGSIEFYRLPEGD